ncbi:hypothetical protein NDU88_001346 [Pleurodeles waltl]|uniref:Uncharacterized protein n=1 Tax=Pleurodeles waltl TaxID=8319 RepID=A0AAV7WP22_PLEWA|nr:hypothetical protein NDU88_001346 [Pleurodeles waltl]
MQRLFGPDLIVSRCALGEGECCGCSHLPERRERVQDPVEEAGCGLWKYQVSSCSNPLHGSFPVAKPSPPLFASGPQRTSAVLEVMPTKARRPLLFSGRLASDFLGALCLRLAAFDLMHGVPGGGGNKASMKPMSEQGLSPLKKE